MDKKTKIFFVIFFTIILAVVLFSFYKFFILKNYYITSELECNPATESCFINTCDPAEDNTCVADKSKRVSYYKLIEKKAFKIPLCDPSAESCAPLSCEGDSDCKITLCDKTKEDCMYPELYFQNNPPTDTEIISTTSLENSNN